MDAALSGAAACACRNARSDRRAGRRHEHGGAGAAAPRKDKHKPRQARRISTPLPAGEARALSTRVIAQDPGGRNGLSSRCHGRKRRCKSRSTPSRRGRAATPARIAAAPPPRQKLPNWPTP